MAKKSSLNYSHIMHASMLISGTAIGAGMLSIPLFTAAAGFVPAIILTLCVWAFMTITGLFLLEASLTMPLGSHFLSIAKRYLGENGKWVTGLLFIFLYYCAMVAYFAGGTPLLNQLLMDLFSFDASGFIGYLIFGLIFGAIVAHGPKSIDRVNVAFVIIMLIAYVLLISLGSQKVDLERLTSSNWSLSLIALPVLFTGFGYHNVIPSLTTYLNKERRELRIAIIIGTSVPFIIYFLWLWVILGSVPRDILLFSNQAGETAATALQRVTENPLLSISVRTFAFFAIVTSLLGVSFSLVDFLADAFKVKAIGKKRFWLTCLTFIPPFIFTLVDPAIFNRALSLAGGFGEALLNGLLPVMFVWAERYVRKVHTAKVIPGGRFTLTIMLALSIFVVLIEVLNVIKHYSN